MNVSDLTQLVALLISAIVTSVSNSRNLSPVIIDQSFLRLTTMWPRATRQLSEVSARMRFGFDDHRDRVINLWVCKCGPSRMGRGLSGNKIEQEFGNTPIKCGRVRFFLKRLVKYERFEMSSRIETLIFDQSPSKNCNIQRGGHVVRISLCALPVLPVPDRTHE